MKDLGGIFIHASDDELQEIWIACSREGFTQDSNGVLQLLMLAVREEFEDDEPEDAAPDPIKAVADHLAANPQAAAALKAMGGKLFGAVMEKFKKTG